MKHLAIFCFVAIQLAGIAELISAAPRFPNIGYVGSSYNMYKGNPDSTSGLDPGFTLRNLFKYTYTNKTTADGDYSLPDDVDAVESRGCSFSFTSHIAQTTSSYQSSLQAKVKADFKGWGASFSASADYKLVHEASTTTNTKFVKSEATCGAFSATVLVSSYSILNPAFVRDVMYLPVNSTDESIFYDFYDFWGTHYAEEVDMGGRYGVQSSFSVYDFATMTSTELDISASAGYSGVFSLNANATTDDQQKAAETYNNYRQDYQIFQVGGKPPMSENMSTEEWSQTVFNNPLPLRYTLTPITRLLTNLHFNDTNIDAKRANLEQAISGYCEFLNGPDFSLCSPIATEETDSETIKVHFPTDIQVTNWTLFYNSFDNFSYSAIIPKVHSTDLYIMGTFASRSVDNKFYEYPGVAGPPLTGQPFVVEDSSLLQDAIDWQIVKYKGKTTQCNEHTYIIRPKCNNDWYSLSDFFCFAQNEQMSAEECLLYLPRQKPCVHSRCISNCRWDSTSYDNNIFRITLGSEQLGNPPDDESIFFWRTIDIQEGFGLASCLSYSCLEFVE